MQITLHTAAYVLLLLAAGLTGVRSQPLAAGTSKFLGAGTGSTLFRDFDKFWNQISPGNDGKWGSVEMIRGTYNWTNLDKIYAYAAGRGLLYKHHTLVWGSQQPAWLSSLDSAAQREAVAKWIAAVGARYTKMALVDVVNEPLHAPLPVYKNALGGDGTTGWDWVITAFELARASCPKDAKLILNDYNILSSTTVTTNFLAIVQLLKDRGLIDGIGIQGHYFEFRSEIGTSGGYVYDIPTIKANLDRLTATGLPVYITEFDIDEQNDDNQLSQYKIYFPIFWNHPGVKGITLWGFIEGDVWTSHPYTYLIKADGTERPALAWLRTFIVSPMTPVPFSPVAVTNVDRNARLIWQHSDSASSYRVQVTMNRSFASVMTDTVVAADTSLRLSMLDAGTTYYWRVAAVNRHGASEFSAISAFTTGTQATSVSGNGSTTGRLVGFHVEQNYPNPFNPSTVIRYELPSAGRVTVKISTVLGSDVTVLVDGEQESGFHSVTFNAGTLAAGVYIYTVQFGLRQSAQRMLLLK